MTWFHDEVASRRRFAFFDQLLQRLRPHRSGESETHRYQRDLSTVNCLDSTSSAVENTQKHFSSTLPRLLDPVVCWDQSRNQGRVFNTHPVCCRQPPTSQDNSASFPLRHGTTTSGFQFHRPPIFPSRLLQFQPAPPKTFKQERLATAEARPYRSGAFPVTQPVPWDMVSMGMKCEGTGEDG